MKYIINKLKTQILKLKTEAKSRGGGMPARHKLQHEPRMNNT